MIRKNKDKHQEKLMRKGVEEEEDERQRRRRRRGRREHRFKR
jgi:hypothetical protein